MKRTLPALASLALVGAAIPTIVPSLANAAATVRVEADEPAPRSVVARRGADGAWAAFLLEPAGASAACGALATGTAAATEATEAAVPCGQPLAEAGVFLQLDAGEPVEGHRLQLEERDGELLLRAVSADGGEALLVGRALLEPDLLAPSVEMNLEPGWEWLQEDRAQPMPGRLVLSHRQQEPLLAMADGQGRVGEPAAPLLARRPSSPGLTPLEAALQGVNRGSSRSVRSSSPSTRGSTSLGRAAVADDAPSGVVSLQVIPFRD